MKKILSLVLAGVMAVGMTVSSFAAPIDSVAISNDKGLVDGGAAVVGEEVTFTATPANVTAGNTVKYEWTVDGVAAGTNSATFKYTPKNAAVEIAVKATEFNTADPAVAVGTPQTHTFDLVKPAVGKITGINPTAFTAAAEAAVNATTIEAGAKVKIQMTADMFTWDSNNVGNLEDLNVTDSQLRAGKITVKSTISKGSKVIEKVEFDKGVLVIEFVEPYVSTKDTDFDFSVYLLRDKTREEGTRFSVVGTLKNKDVTVYADDDEVYLGDGRIAKADAYIKSIKVDLGNDYYITTKMFEGKKYYGVADNEPTAADDDMLTKHPEIAVIYNIKSSGLTSGTATFDLDDKYYVYDKDGKYLGTTADKLAISSKYYLTTKKVDLTSAEEVEEEDDAKEAPVEEDKKPANNNPDTGVNGMVNVAVVAGVVALAAAGAVVLKK